MADWQQRAIAFIVLFICTMLLGMVVGVYTNGWLQ